MANSDYLLMINKGLTKAVPHDIYSLVVNNKYEKWIQRELEKYSKSI